MDALLVLLARREADFVAEGWSCGVAQDVDDAFGVFWREGFEELGGDVLGDGAGGGEP